MSRPRRKPPAGKTADLAVVDVPVGAIHPNPWNPNEQTDVIEKATRESIERFGFIDPVLVRPHPTLDGALVGHDGDGVSADQWQVVDGEHRWRYAADEGYETVPCVVRDLTDDEARKLTIVLNEARGEADVVALGTLLADLKSRQDDFLVALPYTTGELDRLLAIADVDWDTFQAGGAGSMKRKGVGHEVVLKLDDDQLRDYENFVGIVRTEREVETDELAVLLALREQAVAVRG